MKTQFYNTTDFENNDDNQWFSVCDKHRTLILYEVVGRQVMSFEMYLATSLTRLSGKKNSGARTSDTKYLWW